MGFALMAERSQTVTPKTRISFPRPAVTNRRGPSRQPIIIRDNRPPPPGMTVLRKIGGKGGPTDDLEKGPAVRAAADALATAPPAALPKAMALPSNIRSLRGYQKRLVLWAVEQVDPALPRTLAGKKNAYVALRRRLWYSHRAKVVEAMAGGAGLGPEASGVILKEIGKFDPSEEIRFSTWLISGREESDKLAVFAGVVRGRIFNSWANLKEAVNKGSTMPHSYEAAWAMGDKPDLDEIRNLPQIMAALDYWEVTARAWPSVLMTFHSLVVERETQKENKKNSGFLSFFKRTWRSPKKKAAQAELKKWKSGFRPPHWGKFLKSLETTRNDARRGRSGLLRFNRAFEPTADVSGLVRQGKGDLEAVSSSFAKLVPDALEFVAKTHRQDFENRTLRRAILNATSPPYWASAVGKIGRFFERTVRALSTPENLMTALEIGLEIAGGALTGGASILLRVAKWLATTGFRLKDIVNGIMETVRKYSTLDSLRQVIPVSQVFSARGLVHSGIDAIFGKVPAPVTATGQAAPKTAAQKGMAGKLLGKVWGIIGAFQKAWAGMKGVLFRLLSRMDLTPRTWFSRLSVMYYRLVRVKEAVSGAAGRVSKWISDLGGTLAGFIDLAVSKSRKLIAVLAKPGKWVGEIVTAGIEYLLNLLISNPPSAILKAAFKAVSAVSGQSILSQIKKLPFAEALINMVSRKVSDLIGGMLKAPFEHAHAMGKALFETYAFPAALAVKTRVNQLMSDGVAFLDKLTNGGFSRLARPQGKPAGRGGKPLQRFVDEPVLSLEEIREKFAGRFLAYGEEEYKRIRSAKSYIPEEPYKDPEEGDEAWLDTQHAVGVRLQYDNMIVPGRNSFLTETRGAIRKNAPLFFEQFDAGVSNQRNQKGRLINKFNCAEPNALANLFTRWKPREFYIDLKRIKIGEAYWIRNVYAKDEATGKVKEDGKGKPVKRYSKGEWKSRCQTCRQWIPHNEILDSLAGPVQEKYRHHAAQNDLLVLMNEILTLQHSAQWVYEPYRKNYEAKLKAVVQAIEETRKKMGALSTQDLLKEKSNYESRKDELDAIEKGEGPGDSAASH